MKSIVLISFLVVSAFAFSILGCSALGNNFEGDWKGVEVVKNGCTIKQLLKIKKRGDMYFVESSGENLNRGGMGCFSDTKSMSYKDKCLQDKQGYFTACFEGKKLIFTTIDGGEYVYVKK